MFHHHNRFLNIMRSCRILHDAHMFCFIHLVENHPKNHYLIIIIFSLININSTYAFLPSSKPVSPYPSSLLRSLWIQNPTVSYRSAFAADETSSDGFDRYPATFRRRRVGGVQDFTTNETASLPAQPTPPLRRAKYVQRTHPVHTAQFCVHQEHECPKRPGA